MRTSLMTLLLFITTIESFAQTIYMEKRGNVYMIPCKVNGLPLKFIFDTGASSVTISMSEALFMLKNEYLTTSDLKGAEYYRIANGTIQEGTKINIREMEIAGLKLYNIEASISHSLEAPLLLGQSLLEKLGRISIDYTNNCLTIGKKNTSVASEVKPSTSLKSNVITKSPYKIDNKFGFRDLILESTFSSIDNKYKLTFEEVYSTDKIRCYRIKGFDMFIDDIPIDNILLYFIDDELYNIALRIDCDKTTSKLSKLIEDSYGVYKENEESHEYFIKGNKAELSYALRGDQLSNGYLKTFARVSIWSLRLRKKITGNQTGF